MGTLGLALAFRAYYAISHAHANAAATRGPNLNQPPGAPKPFAKPFTLGVKSEGTEPVGAAVLDALRFRDPLKDLAAQRARPLGAQAASAKPALVAAPMPALEPGAPARPASYFLDLGLTCAAMGEVAGAIAALRRATSLDPTLRPAWSKLGDLLTKARDSQAAADAYARARDAAEPAPRPKSTLSPARLEQDCRKWAQRISSAPRDASGRILREHLRTDPTDVAALRLLAEIGQRKGLNAAAQLLLERALDLAPDHVPLRVEYVNVLMAQGKNTLPRPIIEKLVQDDPSNRHHRIVLAICLGNLGEFERSIALYEELMTEIAKEPSLLVNYSYALRYAGRRDDSVRVCRQCLQIAPGSGQAWWSLANIKNERLTPADVQEMLRQLENDRLPVMERYNIHYALGAALERMRDYEKSFTHYAKGAALRRPLVNFNADDWAKEMARHRAFFTADRIAAGAAHGNPDPAPIFIVGLPRVGSTLIEQILATHSLVEGTHELDEIGVISDGIGMSSALGTASLYPERFAEYAPQAIAALGVRYIENTRQFRRTERPFFVDKMPGNWLYIGLILSILPNAKIIDARRHPMASGFAAFKQLFAAGAQYSYDLTELGRYYGEYVKTMAHFDRVMPGRVHRVSYESMVTDTEAEIRRLLDYCALPFEPACLRFWENKRAVATPSAEQVRQPISRDAKDQWRNYEPWLGPLEKALRKEAVLF